MNKLKDKEEHLFNSLSKLDSISDLVHNSKKKIVDLEQLKLDLEQEKLSLRLKLSTLETENISLKQNLQNLHDKVNLEDKSSLNLRLKIEEIESENIKLKKEISSMERDLQNSRYQLAEANERKEAVVKKIDELSQETDELLDGQPW
ncbi:MAG: hypothetical protein O3A26_02015 [Proteobacteria bacterium]|jgi:chromosome segregation ATPase|nr:hypothetical protein [Pseudomonadota bacterium]MDA0971381.1 hypothetical protein [Pseudomonadota bacterium]MDA0995650.1 hypothetical protein [Pseudomonadota bacterium]